MHFLYVFILQFLSNSTCFERPFHSSPGVCDLLYLKLCTNHANVSNCTRLHGLYRAADTVNHKLLVMNKMVIQNM